jgi:hypothetical protein
VSLAVLELNDAELVIGDAGGVLARSPGFAHLVPERIVVGEAARSRSRLDPRRTISQFWLRLGTEPLHQVTPHARHHADLAYHQLLHLHELAGKPAELLLAVPGSFGREQLAILLGIAERCPFRAAGLVDSALAAASTVALPGAALHLELQLHQSVLSRLVREDGMLVRGEVRTVPGTGLAQLQERWARRAAAAFIQQTRFDPLHAAATEQQLCDRLPAWLAALSAEDDVSAELQHGPNRYRATLRAAEMLDAVHPVYQQLLEALARDGGDGAMLLGPHAARLPRLAERIPGAIALDADAAIRGALQHAALIRGTERALRFITRLPARPAAPAATTALPTATASPVGAMQPPAPAAVPTHLVAGTRALRLSPGTLYLQGDDETGWRLSRSASATSRCILDWDGLGWRAAAPPGVLLRIDGLPAPTRTPVRNGTRLGIQDATLLFVTESVADSDAA